jgi:SAM-dependent methyltransferase
MYTEAARYYDLIHQARGRDANAEADLVLGEIAYRLPNVRSLLDVGSGTGANLPRFAETLDVAGLDVSEDMLGLARSRCPEIPFTRGDMRQFDLARTFDSVVCLFSGIGYMQTLSDLQEAVTTMARHVHPGGIVMIEGWVEPAYWSGPRLSVETYQDGDIALARLNRSRRDGVLTYLDMHYAATTLEGLTSIDEHHVMRLSDPTEFATAFALADLSFERLPHMLRPGRSVYVGTKPA